MHIIAIAWLYVIALMALTEASVTGGIMTFIFYGLLPLALLLWLMGTPQRRLRQQAEAETLPEENAASDVPEPSIGSQKPPH